MDDKEIIELYWNRSEQAISETADKYGSYCYCIAHGILQDAGESEECVNDTYFRAWNAIPPHRPNCLRTFLGKITRNLSLNRYEKRTAEKRGSGQMHLCLDELSECISDNIGERVAEDLVIKELLNRFLETLPKEMRNVFVRRYWYMNSIQEIAEGYGISEGKVTVLLFRARRKLKDMLEKEGIYL